MSVKLLHSTPLEIAVKAIRTCWQSQDKSDNCGPIDIALIDRVANKHKHGSTIEHLSYTFEIEMSRGCLQEWARHRMASLSVKSSRYTLKELKDARGLSSIFDYDEESLALKTARQFLVLTRELDVDNASIQALMRLQDVLKAGIANDKAKYCMPEAYKTSLVWTINARSLQNFLALRTSKAALAEIRELAYEVYENLPEDHKFLFKEFVNNKEKA
jgi:thymidylate synthase (FAD)